MNRHAQLRPFLRGGRRGARETTVLQEGVTRRTTEGFDAGMSREPRLHESTRGHLQVGCWARCGILGRSECAAELNARRRVASSETSECSAVLNGVSEKDAATLPNGAMNGRIDVQRTAAGSGAPRRALVALVTLCSLPANVCPFNGVSRSRR